ncbi:hypothetical protein HLB44_31575 [Aquincola sp. S2]|uniref:Uncharacterized protein n=1 Tax=Pseudaquabacterium terrae TaxID=2732868 RepID=A0ABX2ESB7_9BURK|nr:hypothetical protein [Aquabacterium terrae]NRF71538.1 hypothetical protein [Aquabacterium terrae]
MAGKKSKSPKGAAVAPSGAAASVPANAAPGESEAAEEAAPPRTADVTVQAVDAPEAVQIGVNLDTLADAKYGLALYLDLEHLQALGQLDALKAFLDEVSLQAVAVGKSYKTK